MPTAVGEMNNQFLPDALIVDCNTDRTMQISESTDEVGGVRTQILSEEIHTLRQILLAVSFPSPLSAFPILERSIRLVH